MGQDKATVMLSGFSFLEHALTIMRFVCRDVTILGKRELYGAYAPAIEDIIPECGPLSGIHAALTNTTTHLNLIIGVDTPFLAPALLSYVVKKAIASGSMITTPEINNHTQPLCSVYSRDFLPIVEQALKSGMYKVATLFPPEKTLVIQEPELRQFAFTADMFDNLNTPDDLARARRRLSGQDT